MTIIFSSYCFEIERSTVTPSEVLQYTFDKVHEDINLPLVLLEWYFTYHDMAQIRPFRIDIPDSCLQRLHSKLALTDFPSELESDVTAPWSRGPPVSSVKQLAEAWLNTFDWRKAEKSLNDSLPQYTTTINVRGFGDYDIHFVHLRSRVKNAIPLIFLHGWPGNFYEGSKVAHLLVKGNGNSQPAFHVVIPSLIDHGFSSGSRTADFHIDQHAEVAHKLMLLLGYREYVAQGGDTGYLICRMLAQMYPQHCKAHHINMSVPRKANLSRHPELLKQWEDQDGFNGLSAGERTQLDRARQFQKEGSGYFAIHSTRPIALAYSMTDSPVGLLSWIYDKLYLWTDSYPWTPDEILTWVSIYYFSTPGPGASFNTYYQNVHRKPLSAFDQAVEYTDSPLGISRFDKEILNLPKLWNRMLGPIVFEREHDRGGHFAAFEVPELLVGDVRAMFGKGGGAYGAIDGLNGYNETSQL